MTTEKISVADGTTMPAYCARPSADQRPVGVIVAHELFGVNPDIHAPPGRWLERDDEGRREGFTYLNRLGRDQALADVAAALDWLRGQVDRVAMVGFSAGGHLSYLAACRLPIDRVAVLYGGWLPTTDIPMSQPTPTLELTPGMTGRLLYLVGEDDALIDAAQRDQIGTALRDAGIRHELVGYPGTEHAFFWPGTPPFRQQARDDAWSRILALLADG